MLGDTLPQLLADYEAARAALHELDILYADGDQSGAPGFAVGQRHPLKDAHAEAQAKVSALHEKIARTPAITIVGLSAKLAYAAWLAKGGDEDAQLSGGRNLTWPTTVLLRASEDAAALATVVSAH